MHFSRRRAHAKRNRPADSQPASFRPWVETLEDRTVPTVLPNDPVLFWNAVALQATVVDHGINAPHLQFGPTRASQALAIVQGAVYDAVNSIHPQYTKYLTQVQAPADSSLDAAVAGAAYTTLSSLYHIDNQPYLQPYLDAELQVALQHIPLKPAADGFAVGVKVADAILADRASDLQIDAAGQPINYIYQQGPGKWQADPLHPDATPLSPDWGKVTPFVIQSSTQFSAPPPPSITSLEYAQAYMQVKELGAANSTVRTQNETNIGFFWGYDASPGICAPVRFYNQIAEEVAQKMGNNVYQNARFFALITFAEADAAITCWGDKFRPTYDLWRPITAIRQNEPGSAGANWPGSQNPYLVGQGDPTWSPGGAPADNGSGTNFTPPFPTYTSGHGTIGAATFKIMEDFYHTDVIPGGLKVISDEFNTVTVDQNGNPRPLLPRTYNLFSQMAGENAMSRIYLGIHFIFDAVEGIRCGDHIADYVFSNAATPLHGPASTTLPSMDPHDQINLSVALEDIAAHGGLKTGQARRSAAASSNGASSGVDSPSNASAPAPAPAPGGQTASSPTTTGASQSPVPSLFLNLAANPVFDALGHIASIQSADSGDGWFALS
jgi:hypothetical protein